MQADTVFEIFLFKKIANKLPLKNTIKYWYYVY